MTEAMHDNPTLYPILPAAETDPAVFERMVGPNRGTVWQSCWEYVMTHNLTDTERVAFWTGAGLAHDAALEAKR